MSSDISDVTKLLQPELLTIDELRAVLKARCVKVENMGAMSKDQLLNLFNRVITPLQQRVSRRIPTNEVPPTQHISLNRNRTQPQTNENAKKIKLSTENTTSVDFTAKVYLKRKNSNENIEVSPSKKVRQRICWP